MYINHAYIFHFVLYVQLIYVIYVINHKQIFVSSKLIYFHLIAVFDLCVSSHIPVIFYVEYIVNTLSCHSLCGQCLYRFDTIFNPQL